MPYRIDIRCPPPDALDLLVDLGALDIEAVEDGIAAILPDGVTEDAVTDALGLSCVTVSLPLREIGVGLAADQHHQLRMKGLIRFRAKQDRSETYSHRLSTETERQ